MRFLNWVGANFISLKKRCFSEETLRLAKNPNSDMMFSEVINYVSLLG
jgi:hypothetical protein